MRSVNDTMSVCLETDNGNRVRSLVVVGVHPNVDPISIAFVTLEAV